MTHGEGRYGAAAAEAARFRYPDSDVFINRAGFRDQAALDAFERTQFVARYADLPPFDPTNYAALKRAHKHLFGTIYDWAGEERTYPTGRGAAPFCKPEFIAPQMEARFATIRADAALLSDSPAIFAAAAAVHIGEVNAIHPFLEGNGRMQRLLLERLAARAGLAFAIGDISQEEWYAAAAASFERQDYAPLAQIVESHISPPSAP